MPPSAPFRIGRRAQIGVGVSVGVGVADVEGAGDGVGGGSGGGVGEYIPPWRGNIIPRGMG